MKTIKAETKSILIKHKHNSFVNFPNIGDIWVELADEVWNELRKHFIEEYRNQLISELAGIQE